MTLSLSLSLYIYCRTILYSIASVCTVESIVVWLVWCWCLLSPDSVDCRGSCEPVYCQRVSCGIYRCLAGLVLVALIPDSVDCRALWGALLVQRNIFSIKLKQRENMPEGNMSQVSPQIYSGLFFKKFFVG